MELFNQLKDQRAYNQFKADLLADYEGYEGNTAMQNQIKNELLNLEDDIAQTNEDLTILLT